MAAAKKQTKKVAAAAELDGPPMFDRRPGEDGPFAASEPDGSLHAFISARWLQRGSMDLPTLALVPGVPYWLDPRATAPHTDGAKMLKSGALQKVDGDRAALPDVINLADTRQKQLFRDGEVAGPNRQQRIANWQGILIDGSLAECIVNCEDAGLDPTETAKKLVKVYDEAWLHPGDVTKRVWVEYSQLLIAAHKARVAGLVDVPAEPPQEGGE